MADDNQNNRGHLQKAVVGLLVLCVLVLAVVPLVTLAEGEEVPQTAVAQGSSCALVETTTGRLLKEENGHVQMPMASTTKVLTAICVIENADLDEIVKIPRKAVGVEGSSIYLVEGEELTVKELLFGLMLRSGNDSAVALALHVSGSIDEFAKLMNDTAVDAGATSSHFSNPHGLHEDDHYTTAVDLALITARAMRNPVFREIVSTKNVTISGEPKRYLQNKNKMLWNYEGAIGVKTGYTKVAGRCLVSAAERDGEEYIAVVLNTGNMWEKCAALLDEAFQNYAMYPLYDPRDPCYVTVDEGRHGYAFVNVPEAPVMPFTEEEYAALRVEYDLARMVAPVTAGDKCGEISVYLGNKLLFSADLVSISNIKRRGWSFVRPTENNEN